MKVLTFFSDIEKKPFCFLPAQAGVRDGFAIDVVVNCLGAVFDIAFNHQTFDKVVDILAVAAAVEDFFGDTNLLKVLFVGIGMVDVYDAGRVLQGGLSV